MKEQRIKACVYCNAQYAITTEEFEENGVRKVSHHFSVRSFKI